MSETRPEGMCKDCRVKPAAEKPDGSLASRCAACAAQRSAAAKAAREALRAKGLCTWEGGCAYRAAPGITYCSEHAEYHAARRRAERATAGESDRMLPYLPEVEAYVPPKRRKRR